MARKPPPPPPKPSTPPRRIGETSERGYKPKGGKK